MEEFWVLSLRYFIFISNAFLSILGFIIISLCFVVIDGYHDVKLSWYLVILVVVMFITTCFGLLSTYLKHSTTMRLYLICLIICMYRQTVALYNFHTNDLVDIMIKQTHILWSKELEQIGYMAPLEIQYECCGLVSSDDYIGNNIFIPRSCYKNMNSLDSNALYDIGCLEKTVQVFTYYEKYINFINKTFLGFELVAFISSGFLAFKFKQYELIRGNT